MKLICLNGKYYPSDEPILMADNRGFRYGDGLFETMKVINGRVVLENFHFDRLYSGLKLLKYVVPASFTRSMLKKQIQQLLAKNKLAGLARVRLSVFRGNGNIHQKSTGLEFLLECWELDNSVNRLAEKGIVIDVYPDLQKHCDAWANLKSANFLIYVMAAQYAFRNKLDDCLVCNTSSNIADSTIANIFLIKNKLVITPALSQGCVAGVMRRHLAAKLEKSGFEFREGVVNRNDLESFDEVFLTNAIHGMKWVQQFRKKKYTSRQSRIIYEEMIAPLYA